MLGRQIEMPSKFQVWIFRMWIQIGYSLIQIGYSLNRAQLRLMLELGLCYYKGRTRAVLLTD